ncbi:hypothetical protein NQ117_05275 [Paenibacillus sp. SC116]|uniref:hypothetical protein n=1 Tax=Paenibacillus sp. SC116 TaxID=2968986 RepID=UPI00215B3DA7|nr:hypothetical protein [Paenibacillus sp. SC116]MCR8843083.1 hypothetical protein [Paenibacillus sp. SC116]
MSIIPLKQRVNVEPFLRTDLNWNEPIYGPVAEMKCRFQEGVKLVRNSQGTEVVSVGTFYFDKLPSISINDRFTFTNEIGTVMSYTPIAISVKRALNGKPLLMEVNV